MAFIRKLIRNSSSNSAAEYLRKRGIGCLWHFTAASNLDSIRDNGLYSWVSCKRNGIDVSVYGGDEISHRLDRRYGLEDYVRMSLCSDHPMCFSKLKQHGIDAVVLPISLDILRYDPDFICSDINATDNDHRTASGLAGLEIIDYSAVKKRFVKGDDPAFKKHQAEIMVSEHIPARFIDFDSMIEG